MTTMPQNFESIMLGRRSIRSYDTTVKISRTEMSAILADATSAPSSLNMQPWRFAVVDSQAGKEKIQPLLMFNQLQSETSAAIIFVFGDMNSEENLVKIMEGSVNHGSMTEAIKEQQIEKVGAHYQRFSREDKKETMLLDGGLISMNLMLAARKYGYDTCPIGGFDKERIASTLGLDPSRYIPLLALSIGKANEAGYVSYRLPVADITEWY